MIKVGYVFCLGLHGMSPLLGLTWTNPRSTVPSCCNPRFLRILIPSPSRSRTAWTLPQPPSSCPMASTCRGERDGLMGRVWCSLFGGNEKVDGGYCCGKTVWWPVYFFPPWYPLFFMDFGMWTVDWVLSSFVDFRLVGGVVTMIGQKEESLSFAPGVFHYSWLSSFCTVYHQPLWLADFQTDRDK